MQPESLKLNEVRKREISNDITYMWNQKYDTNDPTYKTETDHRNGEQTCGYQWGEWEEKKWDGQGVACWQIQTITFIMDKQWDVTVQHKELCPVCWGRT